MSETDTISFLTPPIKPQGKRVTTRLMGVNKWHMVNQVSSYFPTLLHRALLTSFLCKQNETTVDIESAGHVSVLFSKQVMTLNSNVTE